MADLSWSIATAADIDSFYGERPHETLRAVIIKLDGEPVGIIGMANERERSRAFSEYKPALEPHLKSITCMRAIKAAQRMFASSAKPIIAVREGCAEILERVGFVHVDGDVYLWHF